MVSFSRQFVSTGAFEHFQPRQQQGGIASGHLSGSFPGRTTTDFDGVTFRHVVIVLSAPRDRFRFRSRVGWKIRRSLE